MKTSMNEKWIVCRICLKQPKEAMQTIFSKNEDKDLTQMILECGGVPIKQYDHYPDKICDKCLKYLRVAYKFRVTSQRSHKHLSRFMAPVVVEKAADSNAEVDAMVPDLTLELDEAGEIALKLEPDEVMGIKQEFSENEDGEVVDVYEPMDEDESFEDLKDIESPVSHVYGDDVEYLDDFVDHISTSDEEYVPHTKSLPKKNLRNKLQRQSTSKQSINQKPTTSRGASAATKTTKAAKLTVKKEPKPKKIKESSYICDVCGNIYPSQGRLTEHIKLHKGIKPHECEICGHAFAQVQQLARHMNTHTGNRPYKCTYCPAAFADLSTRNKHHRIHTNERPYVCDVCGKAFTYTNTLKFHKMIHTGEKPFVCDVCGKGFQQAYKLRNHKLTHDKKGVKLEKIEVETLPNYQESIMATTQILEI